jgi:putative IMPACT (imprinted ancient) family translation regulator
LELEEGYTTIQSSGESLFKERNSKFYGYAFQVHSLEEVQSHLRKLREKYPDAGHHVYAYHIQDDEFCTDDGEPKNSSGPPVLRQIQAFGVQQVLVVVIRYFGGKKLGIPGLIQAYGETARLTLENAGQQFVEWQDEVRVTGPTATEFKVYNIASRMGLRAEPTPDGRGVLVKSNPKMTASFIKEIEILGTFDCEYLGRK